MDISRKTDYALRMMRSLVFGQHSVLSVRTAAEENGIPYSFARSIQHDLSEAGIVESTRGAHGGMRLAIDPAEVTMLEFVEALQGPVKVAACDVCGEELTPCPRMEGCPFHPIWIGAQQILEDYFSSFTLKDAALGSELDRIGYIVEGMRPLIAGKGENTAER